MRTEVDRMKKNRGYSDKAAHIVVALFRYDHYLQPVVAELVSAALAKLLLWGP
jgi:hypothetical protein